MRPLDTSARTKRRFTLSARAITQFAEIRGFKLGGLRQGVKAVIRAERQLSPSENVEIDELLTLAFATACAPTLVHVEWTAPLERLLARYENHPKASLVIRVRSHRYGALKIVIRRRQVVAVLTAESE